MFLFWVIAISAIIVILSFLNDFNRKTKYKILAFFFVLNVVAAVVYISVLTYGRVTSVMDIIISVIIILLGGYANRLIERKIK
ncbi:hypothetical protein JCM14036_23420 [Desulfotomaculum defluvii]